MRELENEIEMEEDTPKTPKDIASDTFRFLFDTSNWATTDSLKKSLNYKNPIDIVVDELAKYNGIKGEEKDGLRDVISHKHGYHCSYTDTFRKNLHKKYNLSKKNAVSKYTDCAGEPLLKHATSILSSFVFDHIDFSGSEDYKRDIPRIIRYTLLGKSPSLIQDVLKCKPFFLDRPLRAIKDLTGHGRNDLLILYSTLMDIEHSHPKLEFKKDIDLYDYLKGLR